MVDRCSRSREYRPRQCRGRLHGQRRCSTAPRCAPPASSTRQAGFYQGQDGQYSTAGGARAFLLPRRGSSPTAWCSRSPSAIARLGRVCRSGAATPLLDLVPLIALHKGARRRRIPLYIWQTSTPARGMRRCAGDRQGCCIRSTVTSPARQTLPAARRSGAEEAPPATTCRILRAPVARGLGRAGRISAMRALEASGAAAWCWSPSLHSYVYILSSSAEAPRLGRHGIPAAGRRRAGVSACAWAR